MNVKDYLDELYAEYNRPEWISPDPLELVYRYRAARDREIAGLLAAVLAYGGVRQIVASCADALERLGPSPAAFLASAPDREIPAAVRGFRHRWTSGGDVAALLVGVKRTIAEFGSLGRAFEAGVARDDATFLPALSAWVGVLRRNGASGARRDLLACPGLGSACKRLNLYLRWMVRRDDVDPGVWRGLSPAKLVMPVDVHVHRTALAAGWTSRRQADLRAALEITDVLRRVSPEDPVRYDFALTRAGMRGKLDLARLRIG